MTVLQFYRSSGGDLENDTNPRPSHDVALDLDQYIKVKLSAIFCHGSYHYGW